MTDDEYCDFCMANESARFERTAQGEITIVPPEGGESGYRNTEALCQLGAWAKRDGRGKTFGSSVEFSFPPALHILRMPPGYRMSAWRS
jgi:Uma2 family endonuclease